MLSYPTADGYESAIRQAATDPRWSAAERRRLAAIAAQYDEPGEGGGEPFGTGRLFRAGRARFVAHYASEGVNLGRAT